MKELITEEEMCFKLDVQRVFLWKCRKQGMPYIRIGERIIRYDYDEVLNWLKGDRNEQ